MKKGILDWFKKPTNLLIVLMCVLILVGPTVGFFVANMLNKDIKETRQKEAKDDFDALNRAQVTYSAGPVLPDEQPIEVRRAPHKQLTAYFKDLRERREAQVQLVMDRALERNQAGHTPVIKDLLPTPPERDAQIMRIEMRDRMIGEVDKPSAPEELLAAVDAGMPPDANTIASLLAEYRLSEVEKHKAETGSADMNNAEQKELLDGLVKRRIGEYQRRAGELAMYAGLDSMPTSFPRAKASEAPDIGTCFEWQWDLWIVQDVLEALKLANTSADGSLLRIPEGVVKRVIKIETTLLPGVWEDSYNIKRGLTNQKLIATDPTFSLTGRVTHDKNELYDVRPVTLSAVVTSSRIPELIDAISATNFMTVTDLDISEVDVWRDLSLGFYYGNDHVVQVDMQIETIWLREWIVPFMPPSVRPHMSVEEGA